MLKQLISRFTSRTAGKKSESDASTDLTDSTSRETGGVPNPDTQDANSSTGTTENETFVGRASGDESGDVGMSGAEARGDGDIDSQGAARRE